MLVVMTRKMIPMLFGNVDQDDNNHQLCWCDRVSGCVKLMAMAVVIVMMNMAMNMAMVVEVMVVLPGSILGR